ncbi:hypothetical protein DSO57_1017486 [Entomophthora muscae]|uniref:Uncharacterized protein n=1 Tax=Entomophthora muscae TaxID=34485 RepID=A0ACC2TRM7_9FUNG|nr:hypothetical protein DSO57_1017486 [Entomophthora muscae]
MFSPLTLLPLTLKEKRGTYRQFSSTDNQTMAEIHQTISTQIVRTPSPISSPTDDLINRFRYSRKDFIVLHCRAPQKEACFETTVFAAYFDEPLTRWFCPRHKEQFPENQSASSNPASDVAHSSNNEAFSNNTIVWKPANLLTQVGTQAIKAQPGISSEPRSLKTSIWNDFDPNSHTDKPTRHARSLTNDIPDPTDKEDLQPKKSQCDSSSEALSADSVSQHSPNLGPMQVTVIDPYISIPVSILNRDREGFIYVYSTTNTPADMPNHWQYYKIGSRMDIKRQNNRFLQRCLAVRQIRDRLNTANFRHLRRYKVSRPNLLKFYINNELMKNFFSQVTPQMDICNWCGGPHRDWYSLSVKGAAQLEKKYSIPLPASLPGWVYINTMIHQLVNFIESTDFS